MKRIRVVFIDVPGDAERDGDCSDADVVLAWDREADRSGAPQNVAELLSLVSVGKPVWYRGGMETVHTAELILGLGCERVLVSKGFFRTERMPEHFVRRLGEACVPVVANEDDLAVARKAGAHLVCRETGEGGYEIVAKDGSVWGSTYDS